MPRAYNDRCKDEEKTKVELEFQLSEGNCAEVVAKLIKSLRDVSIPRNKSNKYETAGQRHGKESKKDRRYGTVRDECDGGYYDESGQEEDHTYKDKFPKRTQTRKGEVEYAQGGDWDDRSEDLPRRKTKERRTNEEFSRRHPMAQSDSNDERQRGRTEDFVRHKKDPDNDYYSRNNRFDSKKSYPDKTKEDEWTRHSQRDNCNRQDGLRNEPFVDHRNKRNLSQRGNRNQDFERPRQGDNNFNEDYGRHKQTNNSYNRNVDSAKEDNFGGYKRNTNCPAPSYTENSYPGQRQRDESEDPKQARDSNLHKQYYGKNTEQARKNHNPVDNGGPAYEGDDMFENFDNICREVQEAKKGKKSQRKVSKKERRKKAKQCKKAVKAVIKRCKAQEKIRRQNAKLSMKQFKEDHKTKLKEFKRCMKDKKKEEKMNEKMKRAAAKTRIADLKRKLNLECQKVGFGQTGQSTGDVC